MILIYFILIVAINLKAITFLNREREDFSNGISQAYTYHLKKLRIVSVIRRGLKLPIYKRRILKQLSEYFGKEALNPVEYYERSWHNRSSRMFCWKEGNNKLVHDIEQVNRRIHWAGAETSNEWFGQMAGAVHSGIRAALEVLCDLRPSVLTADDYMFLRPPQRTRKKPLKTYNDPIYSFLANWKSKLSIGILIILIMYGLKTYLVN